MIQLILLQARAAGPEGARLADLFEETVMPYERQVYFLCLDMLRHPQDAEDAAQEALVKAFRAFSQFEGRSQVSTWLYTIASRTCLDIIRKRKGDASLDDMTEAGFDPPSPSPGAYEKAERRERLAMLSQAIDALPEAQRLVVILSDVHERPLQEVADSLQVPLGTVKSRLNRARARLKAILAPSMELFTGEPRLNGEGRVNHEDK